MLILAEAGPKTRTAGGLILYRLFRGYPMDQLAVLERSEWPGGERLPCRYVYFLPPWHRFESSRFHRWKRSLRAFGLAPQVHPRKLDRLMGSFRPAIVVSVMQHAAYYDTACHYARARGLPFILFVHDVNSEFEPVLSAASRAMHHRDGLVYRYASHRLCVSPEMEALCRRRYGVGGVVLYPNRDEDLRPRPFAEASTLKTPGALSLGFVGNLNYGYGDELVRWLPAVRACRARLLIFSHPPGGSCQSLLEAPDCVDFRGFAPALDAWETVKRECDAVILPYPARPDNKMANLYSYHFPSKLPEYLALGMPVIVSGPPYATGVKWARRCPNAVAIPTDNSLSALISELRDLTRNADRRAALAEAGWYAGQAEFDPHAIRSVFMACLLNARSAVRGGTLPDKPRSHLLPGLA